MNPFATPTLSRRLFCLRTILILCCFADGLSRASGATFAASYEELDAPAKRAHDAIVGMSQMVPQVDVTGRSYYQSDDRRYPTEAVGLNSALTGNRWPEGRVYYQFDSAVTSVHRSTWRSAAATWAAVAGLTFVESTGNGNYISVHNSSENSSYLGMIGGAQEMNIFNWDYLYVIAHEIGHALGMEHEQSRSDRDSYVVIYLNNVEAGHASDFDRIPGTVNYGAYDFDSIMHYDRLAFSRNGLNTIAPVPAYSSYLYTMGQITHLSVSDKSGMALRYPRPATVANDLFVNRTIISGAPGSVTGSNVGAGTEAGEQGVGTGSVWFGWTPQSDGMVAFDTYGSTFDTILTVYDGYIMSQLWLDRSNDDSGGPQSRIAFWALAGYEYKISISGHSGATGSYRLSWRSPATADFNQDYKSDLVWENTATGARSVWFMNGTTKMGASTLPTSAKEWQIAVTVDFDHDGSEDFVWQNTRTGAKGIWLMDGLVRRNYISMPGVSPQWEIAGAGEFNGDGYTDFVWQNTTTGERAISLWNGERELNRYALPTVAPQWRIVGTRDFNGDGSTDLLWENRSTGQHSVWLLDGHLGVIGSRILPTLAASWRIAGTGDFNDDGMVDLIWQNVTTGSNGIWLMNGTTMIRAVALPNVAPQWQIRNH